MKAIVNSNLKANETSTIHRFETAGLGKAPFHFTGEVTEKVHVVPGCAARAGSCCDYCYTCIRYEFWVKSADGKTFKVGCDCIHKTGDRGLIQQISVAERKLRDIKNARKTERINKLIAEAKAIFPQICGRLAEQPHPTSYFASQGKTLLDYINWCFDNGASEKAAFLIKQAAKA